MFIQSMSAFCAFGAAGLWFWSAMIKIPRAIREIDDGSITDVPKPEDDLDRLTNGLFRQSRLSAYAAVAAGLSTFFQVVGIVVDLSTR